MNTLWSQPIIWSYHFLTILRGVESNREKVGEVKFFFYLVKGEVKLKTLKSSHVHLKRYNRKQKWRKEKRASEVVGNCCYLLVTVVFKKRKKTRRFHVAVVGLSVSLSDMPYGPPPYTVTLISFSLSLLFTISDDLLLFSSVLVLKLYQ